MLRTKKAIGNIRAYIMDNFTPENYTDNPSKDFPGVTAFILDIFRKEKMSDFRYHNRNEFAAEREAQK